MSSEEDSLVGYDSSEVNKDRSNSLTSVILKLSSAWNIIPESPEKPVKSKKLFYILKINL